MTDEIAQEVEKLQAFVDSPDEVAGIQLRPLTAGTLALLTTTNNGILTNAGSASINDVLAFIYMHAAPVKDVLKAAKSKDGWQDAFLEYGMGVSVGSLKETVKQIEGILKKSMVGLDYEVEQDNQDPNSAARRGSQAT